MKGRRINKVRSWKREYYEGKGGKRKARMEGERKESEKKGKVKK